MQPRAVPLNGDRTRSSGAYRDATRNSASREFGRFIAPVACACIPEGMNLSLRADQEVGRCRNAGRIGHRHDDQAYRSSFHATEPKKEQSTPRLSPHSRGFACGLEAAADSTRGRRMIGAVARWKRSSRSALGGHDQSGIFRVLSQGRGSRCGVAATTWNSTEGIAGPALRNCDGWGSHNLIGQKVGRPAKTLLCQSERVFD